MKTIKNPPMLFGGLKNTKCIVNSLISEVSVCSVKKSISVKGLSVRKSRSEDINKTKFVL